MTKNNLNFRYGVLYRLFAVITIITLIFGGQAASYTNASAQTANASRILTSDLKLRVSSARTESLAFGGAGVTAGQVIHEYKYIINIDNTGTTSQRSPSDGCNPADPDYPASCSWVSVAGVASSSPIYTQGSASDFAEDGLSLPDGRYLISVMADGYKLDGAHFTVPLRNPGVVNVELQPFPLPDATIRARVFEDISPTNSAPDQPAEHGLAGFVGHISDYIGEVTTDIYGNPLCSVYVGEDPDTHVIPTAALDADLAPVLLSVGGQCVSDGNGDLVIPHVGPNRYALSAVRPAESDWVQTTTLEGNHDWDAWVMEGATGFDTEFVAAGEPFPATMFGFVRPTPLASSGGGRIKGQVMATKVYVPTKGGLALPGNIWGGMAGAKLDKPIKSPWIALGDLQNGDTTIYVGQGDENGFFDITGVADGTYTLSYWDEPQDYIFDFVTVTIANGEFLDLGVVPLTGWWTSLSGYVFNDINQNGKKDAGEPGISNFPVAMKKRENSLMDRGTVVVTTDVDGYYWMESAYPMTEWLVMEAYADTFMTTGVTFQADNQPDETTVLGQGVDVNVLPIIGLGGRMDWGVKPYDPGTNGGIVGTVSYDTTRNELDPALSAVEDWQPGISNVTVNLYAPVACTFDVNTGEPNVACDPLWRYQLAADGSLLKGNLLNQAITETWERPTGCEVRDLDGTPLQHGIDEDVLPLDANAACLEGPLMGIQYGPMSDGTNFGAAVDGNYGFGDACLGAAGFDPTSGACVNGDFTALPVGDYIVEVDVPKDALNRDLYKVTREEDINIFDGDQFVPQIPPPECVGPLHRVDLAGSGTDGYTAVIGDGLNGAPVGVTVPASSPTLNPNFVDGGGTPYEGQIKPLCDMKLVHVSDQRSIAPTFNFFTDVPIPGRFWGLIVDDLNFSTDPKSLLFGEKAGVPFAPVGIYDFSNRLVTTVELDYNGLFDVLLPSSNRINCPTPSGVCANLYRLVGNDPGTPNHWNQNYNSRFRTIAAEFEAFPGLIVPADLAPTQVGVTVQLPGGQTSALSCSLDSVTPQLFAVSKPYANLNSGPGAFTITGLGFGALQGSGLVTLDGSINLPISSWSDTQIGVSVPVSTQAGVHQLAIKANNGLHSVNGLSFHVLSNGLSNGPFPATGVLDNFNRNSTNDGLGGNWFDDAFASIFNTNSNQARVRGLGNSWWGNTAGSSFGINQEAYFTFGQVSNLGLAVEQGLLLKFSGGTNPGSNGAAWIEVAYGNDVLPAAGAQPGVRIFSKSSGSGAITTRATFTGAAATFAAGDQLGARALSNGTIVAYKNGTVIGQTTFAPSGSWTGRIGVRFGLTGFNSASEARFDDFGGGDYNAATSTVYMPNLYEVGPGYAYSNIQNALDAAAASSGDDLVVVYPGLVDPANPRFNPRGAYYENLIMYSPVKLQGVGPGGVYVGGETVGGSIIDGIAFGGDTALADAWRTKIASLTWSGNQTAYEAAVITVLASENQTNGANQARQFTADYKAAIDGFDLRGGDQMGFPNNINIIGGGDTGLPPAVEVQGGAVFANAFARHLQITNNVVQNNGGSYGTIRIGTPNLPEPNTDQQNDNVRIANNRIISNAGTNLAGAIGLFAGSESYEVAMNDICGNFSSEYGGGLSVYGYSPSGKIHDNRIYFNSSYDEGAGVMIAGQLPADPMSLSPGSGPVDIYNNLIQANLANDDGGGIRFLMAGNFTMNVFNNMIVNNISTHEGGGIALDDAPDVRVFNNTIMKNITTATAVTSLGQPAPAGLATGANSVQLQATLPGGAATFSNPLLFNNIFWDNRAGTLGLGTVTGIGMPGDASPMNYWDMGAGDESGVLSPTNTIYQQDSYPVVASPTNKVGQDPTVLQAFDVSVAFAPWRTNPNFIGAIMVTADLSPDLMGNYHIPAASAAIDSGASSNSGINAPLFDIDLEVRPGNSSFDIGADEIGGGNQPVVTFPKTPVLDNFNRSDGNLGSNWVGNDILTSFRIQDNEMQVLDVAGSLIWNINAFGPNQEAYFTFTDVGIGAEQAVYLKFNGRLVPNDSISRFIEVGYNPSNNSVRIWTKKANQNRVLQATINGVTLLAGDVFGARALADGTVSIYKNGIQVATLNVTSGSNPWPLSLAHGGGRIGVRFNGGNYGTGIGAGGGDDANFDDFGGGSVP